MGNVTNRYETSQLIHPSVMLMWSPSISGFAVWNGEVIATGASYTNTSTTSYISNASPVTTNAGLSSFVTGTLSNGFVHLKDSAGNLYGINAVSNNSAQTFLKLYEMPSANLSTGLSIPYRTYSVPANSSFTIPVNGISQGYFTGLSMLATSILGNQVSQNAPTNSIYVDLQFS